MSSGAAKGALGELEEIFAAHRDVAPAELDYLQAKLAEYEITQATLAAEAEYLRAKSAGMELRSATYKPVTSSPYGASFSAALQESNQVLLDQSRTLVAELGDARDQIGRLQTEIFRLTHGSPSSVGLGGAAGTASLAAALHNDLDRATHERAEDLAARKIASLEDALSASQRELAERNSIIGELTARLTAVVSATPHEQLLDENSSLRVQLERFQRGAVAVRQQHEAAVRAMTLRVQQLQDELVSLNQSAAGSRLIRAVAAAERIDSMRGPLDALRRACAEERLRGASSAADQDAREDLVWFEKLLNSASRLRR